MTKGNGSDLLRRTYCEGQDGSLVVPVRSGSLRLMRSMSLSPGAQGCWHTPIGSKIASLTILGMGSEPSTVPAKVGSGMTVPLYLGFGMGQLLQSLGVRQTDVSWVIEGRR